MVSSSWGAKPEIITTGILPMRVVSIGVVPMGVLIAGVHLMGD